MRKFRVTITVEAPLCRDVHAALDALHRQLDKAGGRASRARVTELPTERAVKIRSANSAAYRVERDKKPEAPLCAVEDCTKPGVAHRCPADGADHHHGRIHYAYCATELKFRSGDWYLICDEHYEICVRDRRALEREQPPMDAAQAREGQ